jgi:hypothetical protein
LRQLGDVRRYPPRLVKWKCFVSSCFTEWLYHLYDLPGPDFSGEAPARAEKASVRAKIWGRPQFIRRKPEPTGFFVEAKAALRTRLKKCEATINASDRIGVGPTRLYHRLHQRLVAEDFV